MFTDEELRIIAICIDYAREKAEDEAARDEYAENPPHGAPGHRLSRFCDQCEENGS